MLIIINILLLGLIPAIKLSINDNEVETQLKNQIGSYVEVTNEFNEEFTNPTPETQTTYLDKQYGDLKFAGGSVFDIIRNGIPNEDVETCVGEDCNSEVIKWIGIGIGTTLGVLDLIIIIELFFVFYSKKWT